MARKKFGEEENLAEEKGLLRDVHPPSQTFSSESFLVYAEQEAEALNTQSNLHFPTLPEGDLGEFLRD